MSSASVAAAVSEADPTVSAAFDPGIAALALIARFHGVPADPAQIRHEAGIDHPFESGDLVLAARRLGLKARATRFDAARLAHWPMPALVMAADGRHFVLASVDGDRVLIQEAGSVQPRVASVDDVRERSLGQVLFFASRASLGGEFARFDFSWFIPAFVRYRRLLGEVLLVSAFLQVFGLATPLMMQVVMDKVLVNRAFDTLNVVCIALLVCAVFEVVLTGLRNYVFSHTTNRIDVELGAKLYRHLTALPLGYFVARRVGDTVARVRELESIRNFLTGQALTAVLDLLFSVIFIGVMAFYSWRLTLIVVASLPLYVLISALISPVLRRRLNEKFARGADNQAFLVENVSNIETVKAMAIEPPMTRRWDTQLAAYVAAGFRVGVLANVGQQAIQFVGKLVNVATLYFGAKAVISGQLSIGQLIAFNMLAQRVAMPVLRLAQLWQDFQQVGISVQRLGDILNTRTELPQSRQTPPAMQGEVRFENVRFRYRPDAPPVLHDLSVHVPAGQVVGIVGRSGSGKSTLARLLQRLYVAEQGRIQIDGIDLSVVDPAWLRRQIGVVPQESRLFNRSIRDNIAIADPGAPIERVIEAARMAGADEFINELPQGYDTVVGEQGASMSGGQRQRIAIARALLCDPRILVFDEATSALDVETEQIIQRNLRAICAGRTVFIITHRLSTVRHADVIWTMDRGRIVERGTHDELVGRGGYYAQLVGLQS